MAQQIDVGLTLVRVRNAWDGRIGPSRNPEEAITDKLDSDGRYESPSNVAAAHFNDLTQVVVGGFAGPSLSEGATTQLFDRLGGLVDAFVGWDPRSDRICADLENALTLATSWNADGEFWTFLRSLRPNLRIVSLGLEAVILSRQVAARVPDGAPIYEREMLEELHKFEHQGDWGQLMDMAGRFPTILPEPPEWMAIQGLLVIDWPRLITVADRIDSWMHAASFIRPLSMREAIRIATASRSDAIKFAVLERAMHREDGVWDSGNNKALRNFFICLSVRSDWPRWLNAINRYPVRCRQFQTALGQALARMKLSCFSSYVSSLHLSAKDEEARKLVAECLTEFRSHARISRRRHFWEAAFERWTQWNFGVQESERLTAIAHSALDFAVLGHLIEGDGQKLLASTDSDFEFGLKVLEAQWHSSITDAIARFHRLLSRYQIFAAAQANNNGNNMWTLNDKVLMPAAANELVLARYKLINPASK